MNTNFVFECSNCGVKVGKAEHSLTKVEHAYLVSLGLLQPKKKKAK